MSEQKNTNKVSSHLLSEIKEALESVNFGSIEIFVQDKIVTQITVRNIKKTSVEIESEFHVSAGSSSEESTNGIEKSMYIRRNTVRVR
jgi:hypothetical protein